MSGFAERRFLRFILFAASFLVVPAFAQFEIAPDHFDVSGQKTAEPTTNVKSKAKAARHAAAHPASLPLMAGAVTKRKQSPRAQQNIARRSKADVELASSHR